MNMDSISLKRRTLLQSAGALILAVKFGDLSEAMAQVGDSTGALGKPPLIPTELDSWIALAPDGTVTLFFGKVDMGQGVNVAIAQIVADELDVDIACISVVMGDNFLSCNQGGASGAGGVSRGGKAFRVAAAEVRSILLARASEKFDAPVDRLIVADGVISVVNDPSKRVAYAALLSDGFFREQIGWNKQDGLFLELKGTAKPKTPDQYKVVGKSIPRADVEGKVFGTRPYVTDIRVEGMLHGRMIRPSAAGAVPLNVDETSIQDFAARVVRKGNLIGVVAEKEWNAVQAAKALKVTWSEVPDAFPNQGSLYDVLRKAPATLRKVPTDKGNIEDVFSKAAHVMEAEYEWPFQSHACMGGACAVVDVRSDGATVWTGTQKPHFAAQGVAGITGLKPENVHAIWVEGPGSYGRNDAGDASHDAAVLSQVVGRPVRVQYMRNEGTGWDPKAPPSVTRMRAGLDVDGKVIAWDVQIKGLNKVDVSYSEAEPGDTLAGQLLGFPRTTLDFIAFSIPEEDYQFANKRLAWEVAAPFLYTASPLRTAHMRDPAGPQNHFASESFVDEVAAAVRIDPVQFRLSYLTELRDIAVIKAVVERAGWKVGPTGARRGRKGEWVTGSGFAYCRRDGSLLAMIADVEVNGRTGELRVPRIVVAHDCGLIINPGTLKNVIEGGVLQGLSRTIHEEVHFSKRAVTSVDWISYPILDISEAPTVVDVVLIDRPDVPSSGSGESGVRIVAAAVNNAFFEATGKRIRRAPLNAERIRQALA
ncbi:MAG: molybdopterin cofactor-binding domain-containing protein [Steroidobacteraceae bacterium]